MMSPDEAIEFTGHAVGGVCAFGISRADVKVYADISLRRFTTVFPACGSANSAIEMSPRELFSTSKAVEWVDVCRGWDSNGGL
jgi:prolyl-tRNA editing enzyme YbaK/EbsC (Cys-tRNA(Pro) deacylase)